MRPGIVVGLTGIVLISGATGVGSAEPETNAGSIVVTASRRATPLADTPDVIQVIDRKMIEEINPSKTGDLLDYVTGTAVETGTGVGLPNRSVVSLNGLPANYTLVLVDGVPLLSEHIHTGQNIESIPPQAIERIEVMRGAASSQYGTGPIGGIVNIITRKNSKTPVVSVETAAGSYDTREGGVMALIPAGEKASLSSFTHWEESDGIPLKLPVSRAGHTACSRLSTLNRVDAKPGENTELFTSLGYVWNTMDFNRGTSAEPKWGKADMHLVTPSAGIKQTVSPVLDLSGDVAYSYWENEASAERNMFWAPSAHADWYVADDQTLMAGGDYRWNKFERVKVPAHDQEAHGVFFQHDWTRDFYSTMFSLRYDKVEDVDAAWSPKLAVMYAPAETLRLRTSVGRGFHAPTLQELYEEGFGHSGTAYRFGNPDLEPEYSTTCTLGLEFKPVKPLEFVLHGYYSDIDDMIVPVYEGPWAQDPTVNVWRRTNIEKAEVYGAEAAVRWNVTDGIKLDSGYTWTDNRDKETGRQLPYRPGSSVYSRLSVEEKLTGNLSAGGFLGIRAGFDREAWNWKPAAGSDPTNPDGLTTSLEDYTRLDAGVSLTVAEVWEFFLRVENILGEDIENLDDAYTVIDGEPVWRVGVRYTFAPAKEK